MNEILKFENRDVNIIVENGEPLFEIYSTGMALGQVKKNTKGVAYPRKERIDENIVNAEISTCVRNGHKYITEPQLYDLMLEMKTDKVKPFRKWVTNEVLPTIRKTGGYVGNEDMFVDTYLPYADENVKQLFKLNLMTIRQLNTKIDYMDTKIEYMEPLAEFAEAVSNADHLIDMGQMAKLLKDQHIPIGRNRLFDWLRGEKILMRSNVPYQQYIDRGYFEIKERVAETANGTRVYTKTFVTGKGQVYLVNKLRKWFEIEEEAEM